MVKFVLQTDYILLIGRRLLRSVGTDVSTGDQLGD